MKQIVPKTGICSGVECSHQNFNRQSTARPGNQPSDGGEATTKRTQGKSHSQKRCNSTAAARIGLLTCLLTEFVAFSLEVFLLLLRNLKMVRLLTSCTPTETIATNSRIQCVTNSRIQCVILGIWRAGPREAAVHASKQPRLHKIRSAVFQTEGWLC